MNKKTTKLITVLIMLLFVVAGGTFIFYNEGLKPVGNEEEKVVVTVEEGTSYQGLFNQLKEDGLIKSTTVAKLYFKLNDVAGLQPNTYELNKGLSFSEIMRIVSTGDFNYLIKVQMTVPEGLTIPEVADIVAKTVGTTSKDVISQWEDPTYLQTLIDDYDFLTDEILQDGIMFPLEGYLYPETYTIASQQPSIDEVTRMMLDLTGEALQKYQAGYEALNFTAHEFLAFASVVERESLFDEDRPKIAEVFLNRMQDGMNLESDITVLYALQRTGIDVTYEDLETDSPYNTYMYYGLPIGPISNVSDITMKSCVEHEENDYLYFYADPEGNVHYAETYDEHAQNIRDYPWD